MTRKSSAGNLWLQGIKEKQQTVVEQRNRRIGIIEEQTLYEMAKNWSRRYRKISPGEEISETNGIESEEIIVG